MQNGKRNRRFSKKKIQHIVVCMLSTVSSTLNSTAAVVMQEFVRPWKPNLSDKHATIITKVLSLVFGVLPILLVLFAKYFGSGILSVCHTSIIHIFSHIYSHCVQRRVSIQCRFYTSKIPSFYNHCKC